MKIKKYWVITYRVPGTFSDINGEYVVKAKTPAQAVNRFYSVAQDNYFLKSGCKVLNVKLLDMEVA